MSDKVAVVTGSNKGIGYGIVKALCNRGVGVVYLTARDIGRGLEAVDVLKKENISPEFHQLDITNENSIKTFAKYLKTKHGGIDILINNAGVLSEKYNEISYDDAKYVIEVNYKSYFNIQDFLFPILNDNARVINMTSDCGHISNLKNKQWIDRLTKSNLEVKDIDAFTDWFLESVEKGTLKAEDFVTTLILAYRISKIAVCALTRIQQRKTDRGISINSLHPGFVQTDMTKTFGELTIDDASAAAVYLALDCDQSLKGKYIWYDKSEKDWADPSLNILVTNDDVKEVEKLMKAIKNM